MATGAAGEVGQRIAAPDAGLGASAMPEICEVGGGGGMVLPLFGDAEHRWPGAIRAILYGMAMVYLFMGVAIIADAFVAAIECVTARKKQQKDKSGRLVTDKVWNDTVATLSLLALGSSAPEIALSVIDLFKKQFYFAPLGAQTISGSAAFNLLVIVAVCIMVIPSTETRVIEQLPAFYVTAAVSVFAYFWLALILIVRTPNVVEVWEAVATFLYLPALIWISYKVDVGDAARFLSRITGQMWHIEELDEPQVCPVLTLPWSEATVEASPKASTEFEVPIKRPFGVAGAVTVEYRTEGMRATPDYDYVETSGTLEFAEDEPEKSISVEILPKAPGRVDRKFLLVLSDPQGGVGFDAETDGGTDSEILTVTIRTASGDSGVGTFQEQQQRRELTGIPEAFFWLSEKRSGLVRDVDGVVNFNGVRRAAVEWKEQLSSAVYCLGSYEEQKEASAWDWCMHFLTLPWKLLCVLFIPPTALWGGWAAFFFALAGVAIVTIFVSDLAELFGCVVGIRDDVTALAFVALGTSMPDLFASLASAKDEENADASIVNVTGSNSVNVFLGLGLPWTIGAFYWSMVGPNEKWRGKYLDLLGPEMVNTGGMFVVESRNLGFCVMIFGVACAAALLLLHLRRRWLGAELGGPFVPKIVSGVVFICFYLGFLGVCSWRVDRWDKAGAKASMTEVWVVLAGAGIAEFILVGIAAFVLFLYRQRRDVTCTSQAGPASPCSAEEEAPSKSAFSKAVDADAARAKVLSRAHSQHSVASLNSSSSRGSSRKDKDPHYFSEGPLAVSSCTGIGVALTKTRFRRTQRA